MIIQKMWVNKNTTIQVVIGRCSKQAHQEGDEKVQEQNPWKHQNRRASADCAPGKLAYILRKILSIK